MHERTVRTVVESPVGPVTMTAVDGRLAGLFMGTPAGGPAAVAPARPGGRDRAVLAEAAAQLEAYFAGRLTAFDLPLALAGTPFQQRVWTELQAVPYGTTVSYGELAERIGRPTAARAVGAANGRNPIGIVVPCHRVLGAAGRLVGYAGGLDRKRFLLDLERGAPARTAAGAG
jgi:methylated-DNA-[protein]-cysteine S-methyltransferase